MIVARFVGAGPEIGWGLCRRQASSREGLPPFQARGVVEGAQDFHPLKTPQRSQRPAPGISGAGSQPP